MLAPWGLGDKPHHSMRPGITLTLEDQTGNFHTGHNKVIVEGPGKMT